MKRSWIVLGLCAIAVGFARADDSASSLRYLSHEEVAASFAKAAMIRETSFYKVHTSHREAPGVAEIHLRDTDVIYVVRGAATFVTGGAVPDAKSIAVDEVRGARIVGGETRRLSPGDVIIVPNGMPHWFQAVTGPLDYFVVKVTAPSAESAPVGGKP